MQKGIAVAGNLITDIIKIVDVYPAEGMLCNISSEERGVGGCVCNTAIDLALLDSSLPVYAIGKVGADDKGDYLLSRLNECGVYTSGVKRGGAMTAYTDVMTVQSTGARTFFHARGANAGFCPQDIDWDSLSCDILHIGYALLLDCFDAPDSEYGTVLARTLAKARSMGIKTSIDVVSEHSDRFKRLVTPCLPHCDYIIINEIEGGLVSGLPARGEDGALITENLKKICEFFLEQGVKELVCLHFPEGGVSLSASGEYAAAGSLSLPEGYIKGTVGAGDAFCAGMLYSLYKGYDQEYSLRVASCAAACNLSRADSVSGMRGIDATMELDKQYGRKTF